MLVCVQNAPKVISVHGSNKFWQMDILLADSYQISGQKIGKISMRRLGLLGKQGSQPSILDQSNIDSLMLFLKPFSEYTL